MLASDLALTADNAESALDTSVDTAHGLWQDNNPLALAKIYEEDIHIAVWQRKLSYSLRQTVKQFTEANPTYKHSVVVTPQNALSALNKSLGRASSVELCEDIAELVDMFCMLFELQHAGIRLNVLDKAMCPKFHVDRIPCRLATTYQGVATDWLPHERVDRSKLGHGSGGKADHESGLFDSASDIQHLQCGDVALLKGDLWEGNEGAGLVHRSPGITDETNRLLLTIDFIN